MIDVRERFLSLKAQIDEEINKLMSASQNHFGVDPEHITWANIGGLNHLLELLNLTGQNILWLVHLQVREDASVLILKITV